MYDNDDNVADAGGNHDSHSFIFPAANPYRIF